MPTKRTETARPRAIGLVAPSGYLPKMQIADRAARFFAQRGWRVQAGESVFAREQRFAGSDDLRAMDLQGFATDRSLDVVLAARGGYGLSRILTRLDYVAIARAGRILVGYSDFTAFSLALLAKAGAISFQGPAASDFAAEQPNAFTVDQFFATIGNRRHALKFDTDSGDLAVRGKLWGGNLAMVCALAGTPFFPSIRGGILFLEDVNEPAYGIERMLIQLLHAGVLQRQRAILLGSFEPVTPMPNDNGFGVEAAVAYLRSAVPVPIVRGLPFGHVARKATLPVGAAARLVIGGGVAELSFTGHPTLT
ncbi:MAG: LD-carboxypeptidase [Gemmatimonadota bacterium]